MLHRLGGGFRGVPAGDPEGASFAGDWRGKEEAKTVGVEELVGVEKPLGPEWLPAGLKGGVIGELRALDEEEEGIAAAGSACGVPKREVS